MTEKHMGGYEINFKVLDFSPVSQFANIEKAKVFNFIFVLYLYLPPGGDSQMLWLHFRADVSCVHLYVQCVCVCGCVIDPASCGDVTVSPSPGGRLVPLCAQFPPTLPVGRS